MATDWKRANTDWLHAARFGTMTHFLAEKPIRESGTSFTVDDWDRLVDAFDVERFAMQVAETGSRYHIFTVGQNSGFFCSPNSVYDAIVGTPSRLSRRDLIGELAEALAAHGVRTIAYLSSCAPCHHREAVEALGFTPSWDFSNNGIAPGSYLRAPGTDDRLSMALRNWEAIVAQWSRNWGASVSGWWFDGCYYVDKLYRHDDAPNFRTLAEAAKAGNPDSLVAFNTGVHQPVVSASEYEDYTAGELDDFWVGNGNSPLSRSINGAQLHVLTYLGEWWGRGPVRINTDLSIGFTRHVNEKGGAVTWDVPIGLAGTIPEEFAKELASIGRAATT
ncbi:MAG: hypothetical protein P4L33_01035 [Capsulimonadaceae bacterium]|nr:hypothetical protein [Capsulimonadaceae bacterium]